MALGQQRFTTPSTIKDIEQRHQYWLTTAHLHRECDTTPWIRRHLKLQALHCTATVTQPLVGATYVRALCALVDDTVAAGGVVGVSELNPGEQAVLCSQIRTVSWALHLSVRRANTGIRLHHTSFLMQITRASMSYS